MTDRTTIDSWERPGADRRAAVPAPAAPTRVLLADDDDEMRRTLAAALRRDGYIVIEARNGTELIEKAMETILDRDSGQALHALVTDIRMPVRSGMDAMLVIRNLDPGLPIVLITAFGDPETHEDARWMGADTVLDKPFDIAELRRALRRFAPPV